MNPPTTTTWQAVLSDRDGFVYPTVAEAINTLGKDTEIEINVARGTAAPHDGRQPGSYASGDVAYEIECYLIDPDDASVGAEVRYAQAQAMANGLNAAQTKINEESVDLLGSLSSRVESDSAAPVSAPIRSLPDDQGTHEGLDAPEAQNRSERVQPTGGEPAWAEIYRSFTEAFDRGDRGRAGVAVCNAYSFGVQVGESRRSAGFVGPNAEVERLRNLLDIAERRVDAQRDHLTAQLEQARKERDEMGRALDREHSFVKSHEGALAELRRDLAGLTRQRDDAHRREHDLAAENARLRQQLTECRTQRDEAVELGLKHLDERDTALQRLDIAEGDRDRYKTLLDEVEAERDQAKAARNAAVNAAHRQILAYQAGNDQLLADIRTIRHELNQARLCDDCHINVRTALNTLRQLVDDLPTPPECGATEPVNSGVCVRPLGHAGETRPAPVGFDQAGWAQGHHYAYPIAEERETNRTGEVYIQCDADDCDSIHIARWAGPNRAARAAAARARLAARGWDISPAGDYCPTHKRTEQETNHG